MVDLKNVDLLALQSRYMQGDITTQALCAALTPMFQELAEQINEVIIYPRIDELSGGVLDALAWGFHVDSYDALADDAEKRRMIKSSVVAHKFKGTVYSVRTIVESIFGTAGSVPEWFQYGGNPYYFKVIVDTYLRGISESDYSRLISGIEPYKSLRSVLESVTAKLRSEAGFGLGAKTILGDISVVFPDLGEYDQEKSGQTITITGVCPNTHFQVLQIAGATKETGTGTKSPDDPYVLSGATKATVTDGVTPHNYALPQMLYNLPNGVCDTCDAISGLLARKVGKVVLTGSESWSIYSAAGGIHDTTICFFASTLVNRLIGDGSTCNCDRFIYKAYVWALEIEGYCPHTSIADKCYITIKKSRLAGWSDTWTDSQKLTAFKTWLAANPVTVLYQLAVPQTITGTAQQISAFAPTSYVSVDSGSVKVKYNPYLEAVSHKKAELNGRG